jgi:hypothetical protein
MVLCDAIATTVILLVAVEGVQYREKGKQDKEQA